jgi:signal transduction histidine kinase
MRLGRRLVGAMTIRPIPLRDADRSFLETLAGGVAEVASRGALRARLEEANRERALAAERERIAADLHDTAGQVFIAIGLMCKRHVEQLPAGSEWSDRMGRLVELASTGKWEIDQTIRALAFFPAARRGIVPSIHSLGTTFTQDSDIDVLVEVTGEEKRLPLKVERALYRVAHEALVNAWSHARCSSVRIELTFEPTRVLMDVVDDGIGLLVQDDKVGRRMGLLSMRRAVDELNGTLQVRDCRPRGVRVHVQVPLEDR